MAATNCSLWFWFIRSYDSKNEDAQNPWPKLDDSTGERKKPDESTGKTNFQKARAKPPRVDTQDTLVVETPPHRAKSVDAGHSETKSKCPKRSLSCELNNAATPRKKLINLGPSNPAPKKKNKTPEDKKKEKEEAKLAAYEMKDHATARSSSDPMPRGSRLAKKGGPKAKASPVAKKPSSPATAKTKDPAEKPTKTPKSTPPAATTKENRDNKKARTTSPDKNEKKARGRSPPSHSHEKSPKKARAAHSPNKSSTTSTKKKAPESANNDPETSRAESPKTSGENNGSKKSEKDTVAVENKRKAHKLYMRFWRSVNECLGLGSDNEVQSFFFSRVM